MRSLRQIMYGISDIISWIPVIWRDRDWDQIFLYKIISFKLERMEKHQRNYGISINSHKLADQMKKVRLLFNRLIENNYDLNAQVQHDKRWGESEIVFYPIEGTNFSKMEIEVEKATTEELKKKEREEMKRCREHADRMREQDLDMVFSLMRKYIEGWWD